MAKRAKQDIELPAGLKGEKVRRDIATLAMTPVNMNLTVTGRKVYTVLLYLAQRSTKGADNGYSAPLNAIVRGTGNTTKMSAHVLEYLTQMTSTNVIFRPVSENEQYSLLPDASAAAPEDIDEVRTFALLSEARVTKRGGDNWVTWWYPPTIEQQVIDPNRWAVIELDVLAMLTTYTAVALYEIVARYRDAPGQLTPKRPADFWVPILRGNSTSKDREWRKFKAEFVAPAIEQINDVSDLEVGVIEHKYGGRKVIDVQFSVAKKQRVARSVEGAVDVGLFMAGAAHGLREPDLDALVKQHGEDRVKRAIQQLELRAANRTLDPVGKPLSWLKRVLENLPANVDPPAEKAVQPDVPIPQLKPARPVDLAEFNNQLLIEFDRRRQERVAAQFGELGEVEKAEWMDRLVDSLDKSNHAFVRVIRRLRERDWQSPLIRQRLMSFYAQHALGESWTGPTKDDLAALSAELKP